MVYTLCDKVPGSALHTPATGTFVTTDALSTISLVVFVPCFLHEYYLELYELKTDLDANRVDGGANMWPPQILAGPEVVTRW